MERLTERSENGKAIYRHPTPEPEGWEVNRETVLERCCSYEETGLMPEEIEELQERETPNSIPAPLAPDSVECGSCGNDIDMLGNEGYEYCPYCGQKL